MYTLEPAAFFGVLSVGFSIAVRLNTKRLVYHEKRGALVPIYTTVRAEHQHRADDLQM